MNPNVSKLALHWIGVGLAALAVGVNWASFLGVIGTEPFALTRLGLALFYTVLFTLLLIRKPTQQEHGSSAHTLIAVAGTFLPFALGKGTVSLPQWLLVGSYGLEAVGMVGSIVAISVLGRGFGIFAANRVIKTHGLYRWVRHPLYAGEALWFLSIVIQHLSPWNVGLFAVQMACQVLRMRTEEALLGQDPTYAAYLTQVRYRLIPGIF
jgi:protein-S-isoprenylcysteine O-methyltransferase Ste14